MSFTTCSACLLSSRQALCCGILRGQLSFDIGDYASHFRINAVFHHPGSHFHNLHQIVACRVMDFWFVIARPGPPAFGLCVFASG